MDVLFSLFDKLIAAMQIPMNVYGFRFSLWDWFIWTLVASILLSFVWGLFSHD